MKFIPAIDLKDKRCVRLQKGKEEELTIFNEDPIKQAKFFESSGCKRIHIVDLDAAFGRPNINRKKIIEIRRNIKIPIQLGGGIKNESDVAFWINSGINYLIIGSLSVKNTKLVSNLANKYKNKIYISLDVLNEKIMMNGWVKDSRLKIQDILNLYKNTNIRGYVFTDIARDGMLEGLDMKLIESFVKKTDKHLIVGGGLSNYEDLHNIKNANYFNIEGVISGKSFYSGNIKIDKALKIFKENA